MRKVNLMDQWNTVFLILISSTKFQQLSLLPFRGMATVMNHSVDEKILLRVIMSEAAGSDNFPVCVLKTYMDKSAS